MGDKKRLLDAEPLLALEMAGLATLEHQLATARFLMNHLEITPAHAVALRLFDFVVACVDHLAVPVEEYPFQLLNFTDAGLKLELRQRVHTAQSTVLAKLHFCLEAMANLFCDISDTLIHEARSNILISAREHGETVRQLVL